MLNVEEKLFSKISFSPAGLRRYFKNTSWLFLERVVRLLLAFVINIYIIRYLGAEKFGLLSYAMSYVGLFSALAALGLDSLAVRELVKKPEMKTSLLGTVFSLRLFGSFLMILLIFVSFLFTKDDTYSVILILIIAAGPIFQSFWVVDYYNQAKVQIKNSTIVHLISLVISSVIKVILIITHAGVIWFAAITSAEFLFSSIGFIIMYEWQEKDILKWKNNLRLGISLLKDSWPLVLSGVVIAIYMKIGQVMINKMMSNTDLGYYAAAARLSEAWYFVPVAIATSVFPAIVNYKESSSGLYMRRLQSLYDLLTWIAIGIAIPVSLFSKQIVVLLFGSAFIPSASVLVVYIWAAVPVFLGVASSQFLIAENLTRISFYRTVVGMLMNVVLNFIFIPLYGITGSAFATLISYSAATFSMYFKKETKLQVVMMFKSIFGITLFKLAKEKWLSR